MINYDFTIPDAEQIVKITLQQWKYTGHLYEKWGGNSRGRALLDFSFLYETEVTANDCNFKYDEETDTFECILTDKEGNTFECVGDAAEFDKMIVAIEIVSIKKRGKKCRRRGH